MDGRGIPKHPVSFALNCLPEASIRSMKPVKDSQCPEIPVVPEVKMYTLYCNVGLNDLLHNAFSMLNSSG